MNILMVSSESVPFAKTGGLADAVPALAGALRRRGHDVRIVMPRYYGIDRRTLRCDEAPMGVPMRPDEMWCAVCRTVLPGSGVPVYLIDREDLFGRDGLYGPDGSSSWPDNARRFAFFSTAALQLGRYLGWTPDIFHLHDWQAAPAAWLLGTEEYRKAYPESASVLTIHNLGYQGVGAPSDLASFPEFTEGHQAPMLHGGHANYLAGGLACADGITTVSPTYAREILTPAFGEGLDDLLSSRVDRLTGILNGMDYSEWNPARDPVLKPHRYSSRFMRGKAKLKARLQEEMGLPSNPELPLFGMITRLTGQKGIDLVAEIQGPATEVFRSGRAQLAVLGTGETRYEEALRSLADALPQACAVRIAFSGPLSRLIEAGSDFFVMPSRYEPCGLNQMYSLRYGTLPVVRRTGGLADSVRDLDADPQDGDGFIFDRADPSALGEALNRATLFYGDTRKMKAARRRAMGRRFDWDASSRDYETAYSMALERRRLR